jgi:hypothetical protein
MEGKPLRMKKVCSIIFIVTTLSLRSLGALPIAAYSYKSGLVENFDSMKMTTKAPTNQSGQTLWSVELWGSTDFAQNLTVASAANGGRSSTGFNAGAASNTNRLLAIGKASSATFTTKFVNDTANKMTEIELYYDMECPWVSKGKTVVTAKLFGQISTNGATWISLTQFDSAISNSTTTTTDTWLTDAQMDAQKLSKRNVGGIIPLPATLPSIAAGQTFYIRWVTDSDNASDKMTYGIDNLRTFADSDNDGLSDTKEAVLGTNPNKADSDGDGMSDGEEFAYGTDPLDLTSAFDIELKIGTPPSPELDSYIVEWPTADGRFYTLLFAEKLEGSFTPVEGYVRIPGAIGTDAWCSHVTDSETGFYKVLIETE